MQNAKILISNQNMPSQRYFRKFMETKKTDKTDDSSFLRASIMLREIYSNLKNTIMTENI